MFCLEVQRKQEQGEAIFSRKAGSPVPDVFCLVLFRYFLNSSTGSGVCACVEVKVSILREHRPPKPAGQWKYTICFGTSTQSTRVRVTVLDMLTQLILRQKKKKQQ